MGKLSPMFLNRGGSAVPDNDVKSTNDELTFVADVAGETKPVVTLRVPQRLTSPMYSSAFRELS